MSTFGNGHVYVLLLSALQAVDTRQLSNVDIVDICEQKSRLTQSGEAADVPGKGYLMYILGIYQLMM
jgi:hypothetical protein